jgi:hypothetical protein
MTQSDPPPEKREVEGYPSLRVRPGLPRQKVGGDR